MVSDKLKDITNQPNNFPKFIVNGSCSFHNKKDSGKQIYDWPEMKSLVTFFKENVREYLKSICVNENDCSVAGMWANRYPPGTFVDRHNHSKKEKQIVIGVLHYIRKDKDAGNLVIDIPDYGDFTVDMNEGDTVIFQSSLDHWTSVNRSENDKYVIGLELIVDNNGKRLDEI